MPEYLAPGVYVEEVSFRAKSIEGVSTSTAAFVGPTRFGPTSGEPELLTSFNQFERIFGGLDRLSYVSESDFAAAEPLMHNYLAHAVRAFFDNGGRRLYVVRAFRSLATVNEALGAPLAVPDGVADDGIASALIPAPAAEIATADSAASAAVAAANAALSAALAAAATASATAIAALQAAVDTVVAAIGSPVEIDVATVTADDVLQALDDAIAAIGDADAQNVAQAARDAAETTITAAVTARDAADITAAAETEQATVATAIADGRAEAEAIADDALPTIDSATTTAAASATTAGTRTTEATTAATDATTAQQAAAEAAAALESAGDAERLDRAGDAATAAEAAADEAAEAVTAATNARTAARNAARDARITLRAAAEGAVGSFRARFPGAAGNLRVTVNARLGQSVLSQDSSGVSQVAQIQQNDLVLIERPSSDPQLYIASRGTTGWTFSDDATTLALTELTPNAADPAAGDQIRLVTLSVQVDPPGVFAQPQTWTNLAVSSERRDSIQRAFGLTIANRAQMLETPLVLDSAATSTALATALLGDGGTAALIAATAAGISTVFDLTGGNDGVRPTAEEYRGAGDDNSTTSSGLRSLEDIEEISIVAAPGLSYGANNGYANEHASATQALISHCELMRYRVAVLDSPDNQAISQVRGSRALLDTTRAAFYYPWIRIQDPITREPIHVPPSGFVTGIYARNDIDRGVHKAPANEVLRGAIGLETLLNKAQQDVLNPLGINCVRYFENRGIRVWGARTLSSDPEWKYLNIRRYFAYLERSIEKSTQWAVFEPNGDALWANVRRSVEDFLFNEWKSERLAGTKPSEAFFVRCDRSTMTQNDLDNGRMICLIGVAPLYPAEFVIFRIGQWTADRPS